MKKSIWILGLILLIALFLRLFRLTELFHFTMDEELIAWRAWGLFNLNRPFLIGGISPLQVHLPPYFYYLMALLLWPFNFNPLGWGFDAAILAIFTILCLFWLTRKLFDQTTAIYAVIFQTFSFTAVFFDRHFWPMSFNPLFTLLSLWLLTKVSLKKLWPYFILALVLLLALSADPSNLSLALALLTWFVIKRKTINYKFTLFSVLILLIIFLTPLFLFDIRHQWQNFSGINRLLQTTSNHQFELSSLWSGLLLLPKTLARFWYSAQTNLIEVYSYCSQYAEKRINVPEILLILAISVILWFMVKIKNLSLNLILIFYVFGLTIFGSLGYPLFDHYLTGLLPIFAIMTAVAIRRSPKILGWLLIAIFISINLWQISHASHPYGLKFKQEIVAWSNQSLAGESYSLESISKCHRENGLRYLFELSGNPPTQSFMDGNFSWLYRELPTAEKPKNIVTVTDKASLGKKFGGLSVEIVSQ